MVKPWLNGLDQFILGYVFCLYIYIIITIIIIIIIIISSSSINI